MKIHCEPPKEIQLAQYDPKGSLPGVIFCQLECPHIGLTLLTKANSAVLKMDHNVTV